MHVDETKDRVVIHDLEAEIAEIERHEPRALLLPDIDKKFSCIPPMLLEITTSREVKNLVLYQVPASLSVPQEHDAVRKAIIESRRRARTEQAVEHARTLKISCTADDNDHTMEEDHHSRVWQHDLDQETDHDAMEIE